MAITVRTKPINGTPESVTFPGADAELETETVTSLKMLPALTRFAKQLIKEAPAKKEWRSKGYAEGRYVKQECVAVIVSSITVRFVYQDVDGLASGCDAERRQG